MTPAKTPTMDSDLETLRRQLQQLQALHDSGTLGADAYGPARAALERRIVEQVMQAPPAAAQAARPARGLLLGVAAVVLLVAAGGYLWKGTPRYATLAAATAPAAASAPHGFGPEQIQAMVDKLAQRLKENPDDAEAWGMLGRAYAVLGRHGDAVPAYRKALALRSDDAALLADAADALAVVNGRSLAGEPLALVQKALEIEPDNLKALSLAGTAAFNAQDYAGAVQRWERVAALAAPGSPFVARVRQSIAEARSLAGMPAAAATPMPPVAAPVAAAASGATVSGTVTLAASLRAKADPDDTVFVYARAAEGPRMPLAIVRKQVKDLPFDFVLDDSTAMSPATRLSSQARVVVSARITKSGNAVPQPGDLAGQSAPLALGVQGLKLEISEVVGR